MKWFSSHAQDADDGGTSQIWICGGARCIDRTAHFRYTDTYYPFIIEKTINFI